MNQNLIQSARKLRLSGMLVSLEMRLQEATSHQLSPDQFLELVLQDELNVRAHRRVERRKKAAAFRELKPLDEFDWDFNPSIKRAQIYELATANFIRQNRDILLLGPPGVGKSCLAQAIGYAAIKAGFLALYCSVFDLQADESPAQAKRTLNRFLKPDLLCIDDFRMKHFPAKSAQSLLEIIVRRHQNRSTLMTSNRPIEEWGQPLSDIGHTQTRPVVRRSMRKVSQSPSRLDRDRPRVLVRLNTSDVHALRAIFLDREIELALARRPQTIVDAGAFIGLSSLYFAWRYPNAKVIAIEPEKSNYELLLHNIDGWENIIAVRAALWKRSTRLCIHDPGRGNWAYQVFRSKCAVRLRQRVPGVRLESVMEMAGVERVDILKVDIEGAEIEVFETAASWIQHVGVIIVELHDRLRDGCEVAVMRATTDFQIRRRQGEYMVLGRKGWL